MIAIYMYIYMHTGCWENIAILEETVQMKKVNYKWQTAS